MAVTHDKVSVISDGADTSLVQPSDWNANHSIENTLPDADSTYDLGSASYRWQNVYAEGVAFPATQVPSADVNILDDYEEGTWTPGNAWVTYASASGTYTKVGRLVFIAFQILWPSTADSHAAVITGLPFTVSGYPGLAVAFQTDTTVVNLRAKDGTATIEAFWAGGSAPSNANLSGDYLWASGCYSV